MADDSAERVELSLSIAESMSAVDRAGWNALANPPGERYDPFLDWDFLEAAESSGCAQPDTGWTPRHMLAHDATGKLVGAAPLYLKTHSRGEFVFDHSWADALHRAGGRYYPKLLCAVPFTPVTGRRLLATGPNAPAIRQAMAGAIVEVAQQWRVSSAHFNFLEEQEWQALGLQELLLREDQQFHWLNRGYGSFEDFLGALSSRKRKMLRRERREAQEGLRIVRLTGAELTTEHWDAFFEFYMDTGGRKWGSPYLNREFFTLLHERMADKCLLILAYDVDTPIAGALNLIGSDTLYGRYWGRSVDRPFLHFEISYYQAIDFAIERGLARVEAGAQGEHKLSRGYEPALTRSAHWIAHKGLRQAVSDYLDREREAVEEGIDELSAYSPFRKGAHPAEHDEESF
ncbi:MAG TPA: GNAT family N-acetyltransferase [Hyphomonadaceae bacterium]|nr:GNAT family N-acetyltransferase [Hyphomonadaceae bacterium]